jgi:tetrahydromethanopterin S-methyltransferase subunit F
MSEAETLFAWIFGLALGAVFAAVLLMNALAF